MKLKNKLTKFFSRKSSQEDQVMLIQRRLNSVLDTIADNHWWKDKSGRYLGCNKRVASAIGLNTPDEIIGKTDFDMPWSKQAKELAGNDKLVMSSKKIMNFEESADTANGERFLLSTKAPLYDEKGDVIGIIGTSVDITDLKKTQKQLEESKTREAHFKAMSSIGGMMAHELRTPLSAIALSAQNLKKYLPILVKAYREYAKISGIEKIRPYSLDNLDELSDHIERSARYASNTITTILSGFHYSASEMAPIEVIDVNAVLQEALFEYPLSVEEKALIVFQPEKTYQAMGAPSIIIHVLHNLLKNALHAIKEAGKGLITISVENTKGAGLQIIFRDTGKGIAKDVQEHIFEPFYTTKDSETSIGLGLYFCKMALEKMKGSIVCDSKEGEYTMFSIKLEEFSS